MSATPNEIISSLTDPAMITLLGFDIEKSIETLSGDNPTLTDGERLKVINTLSRCKRAVAILNECIDCSEQE